MDSSLVFLVAVIAGGLFLLWIILYFIPIGLWFQALVSDVKVSLLQLVLMRWRKVPPTIIVRAMIEGKKAGLELSIRSFPCSMMPKSIQWMIFTTANGKKCRS